MARISRRQDSGSSRGGGLVIPSSLLRASAVCYVTLTAKSSPAGGGAVRPAQILRRGRNCPELVCGASVHLSTRAGSWELGAMVDLFRAGPSEQRGQTDNSCMHECQTTQKVERVLEPHSG